MIQPVSEKNPSTSAGKGGAHASCFLSTVAAVALGGAVRRQWLFEGIARRDLDDARKG